MTLNFGSRLGALGILSFPHVVLFPLAFFNKAAENLWNAEWLDSLWMLLP
jgi:hypothetical protein